MMIESRKLQSLIGILIILRRRPRLPITIKILKMFDAFLQSHINSKFKFNIALLDCFKESLFRTLGDACEYIQAQRSKSTKTKIKPHDQFNQYARDFTEDNPSLGMFKALAVWALKKMLSSETGRHEYEPSDLKLLDKT
ncbi:MAG: hypothetical protein ACI9SC_002623 [Gammaproteobacteria bacterium]